MNKIKTLVHRSLPGLPCLGDDTRMPVMHLRFLRRKYRAKVSFAVVAVVACAAFEVRAEPIAPVIVDISAVASNSYPRFIKSLFSFPLKEPGALREISGSISISSEGQEFAEALFSVQQIPEGACPANGEAIEDYSTIRTRYPQMRRVASFIVKLPKGRAKASIPISVSMKRGVEVSGCLVLVLDGAVLHTGGPFDMSSNLVAKIELGKAAPGSLPIAIDDEFCFSREGGCQKSTSKDSPDTAFMNTVRIKEAGQLTSLYGTISDSAFGYTKNDLSRQWTMQNLFILIRNCTLPEQKIGPENFFGNLPSNHVILLDDLMTGSGQAALQHFVQKDFSGILVERDDCIVHLVRKKNGAPIGAIDAESQIVALIGR